MAWRQSGGGAKPAPGVPGTGGGAGYRRPPAAMPAAAMSAALAAANAERAWRRATSGSQARSSGAMSLPPGMGGCSSGAASTMRVRLPRWRVAACAGTRRYSRATASPSHAGAARTVCTCTKTMAGDPEGRGAMTALSPAKEPREKEEDEGGHSQRAAASPRMASEGSSSPLSPASNPASPMAPPAAEPVRPTLPTRMKKPTISPAGVTVDRSERAGSSTDPASSAPPAREGLPGVQRGMAAATPESTPDSAPDPAPAWRQPATTAVEAVGCCAPPRAKRSMRDTEEEPAPGAGCPSQRRCPPAQAIPRAGRPSSGAPPL
mmetsp:Transcript_20235/g.63965  ORF Transcript_20235/g.63965 Transcript_20235/m.63965 type:complete len:320 (-) Transcript_20235:156-1115(-)